MWSSDNRNPIKPLILMQLAQAHLPLAPSPPTPALPCPLFMREEERDRRLGWGKHTHLVIPAADAQLATEAVGAGAVVHTGAVLAQEAGGQPDPQKQPYPHSAP